MPCPSRGKSPLGGGECCIEHRPQPISQEMSQIIPVTARLLWLERRNENIVTDGASRSLGLDPSDIMLRAAVGADLLFPLMVIVASDEDAQTAIGSAIALRD